MFSSFSYAPRHFHVLFSPRGATTFVIHASPGGTPHRRAVEVIFFMEAVEVTCTVRLAEEKRNCVRVKRMLTYGLFGFIQLKFSH
jgi:hypothetical protein